MCLECHRKNGEASPVGSTSPVGSKSRTTSTNRSYVGSAMCLECRRKNVEASPVGFTYGKTAQRLPKDQVEGLNL